MTEGKAWYCISNPLGAEIRIPVSQFSRLVLVRYLWLWYRLDWLLNVKDARKNGLVDAY